ncbi:MAG: CvpA family protein [Planctomycetes bacterium]|nr:CvpA family protein [Planctomycetota bacterium]
MWLSLLMLVLVLGVAFFQSTLGFFSALIMTVLTLCCAAAAVGTHEWVAINWLAPLWKPDFAHAIALAAIFGVPLIAFRFTFDQLIRRACLLPAWVDRIGGAFCGIITALTLVGVMAHALQAVPFGTTILGFARVEVPAKTQPEGGDPPKPPDVAAPERELWLSPDRFAIGVASLLSSGVFSGDKLLAAENPDPVQALGWVNTTHPEVSRVAQPNSIAVVRSGVVSYVYHYTEGDPRRGEQTKYDAVSPKAGHEFRMLRVALRDEARDARKSHVFTIRQFRLVGTQGPDGPLAQYFPTAIQQEDATQTTNRHICTKMTNWGKWPVVDEIYAPRDESNEVEVVYELPTAFKPMYLEYKRGARFALASFDIKSRDAGNRPSAGETETPHGGTTAAAGQPAGGSAAPAPAPAPPPDRRRRRGEPETVPTTGSGGVRPVRAQTGGSTFGDELPLTLTSYRSLKDLNLEKGKLGTGHLVAMLDEQDGGTQPPVSHFAVPADKRLLQLSVSRMQAKSGIGKVLDLAATTAQSYFVQDTNGTRYSMIGKYVRATVEGVPMLEVQYFPEQAGSIGGLGPFQDIKDRHLQSGEYDYVLLFLVDPGANIVTLAAGGSAARQDDLSGENLTAPP